MFTIDSLSKSFGSSLHRQQVLHSLSFSIRDNSFTSISGPSGSGKTTLLSILCGLESADSGTVLYKNSNILSLHKDNLAAMRNKDFGFVFQTPFFIPYKTVLDNILLPTNYDKGSIKVEDSIERAEFLASSVGLEDHMHKNPSMLSGGEQQRMAFARALMLEPKVIFADEPTASLDLTNSEKLMQLLNDCVEQGKTVVMVSHDPMALAWSSERFEIRNKGSEIVQV